MTEQEQKIANMMYRMPFEMDWISYKGEVCVGSFNWEASKKAKRPMIDISYCLTKALNGIHLQTVQYDKNKFKPCHLSSTTW